MKLTIARQRLAGMLSLPSSVAGTSKAKPILSNVRLDAAESLTISATSIDVSVQSVGDANIEQAGVELVPAAKLSQIVANSTGEDLTIETHGNGVQVRCGSSRYTLPTASDAEWPCGCVPEHGKGLLAVEARLLATGIKRTTYAVDPQSTRYAIGGVCLSVEGGRLVLVGTDSRRVNRYQFTVAGDMAAWEGMQAICPVAALNLMAREDSGDATISLRENQLTASFASGSSIMCRLVEGRFPRVDTIFDRVAGEKIETLAGDMLALAKQAVIASDHESRGVNLVFADGVAKAIAKSATNGQAESEAVISYRGKPIELWIDGQYLVELFRLFDAEDQLTITAKDGGSPFSVECGLTRSLIMPLVKE